MKPFLYFTTAIALTISAAPAFAPNRHHRKPI